MRWMGVGGLNISGYRQIAIALLGRYCREDWFEEEKTKLKEGDGWGEDNADGDDPWDLQAGHCYQWSLYSLPCQELRLEKG